jgi:hypothetical protein
MMNRFRISSHAGAMSRGTGQRAAKYGARERMSLSAKTKIQRPIRIKQIDYPK